MGKLSEPLSPFDQLIEDVNHPKAGSNAIGTEAGLTAAARIATHERGPLEHVDPQFLKGRPFDAEMFKQSFIFHVNLAREYPRADAKEIAFDACVQALHNQRLGDPYQADEFKSNEAISQKIRNDAQSIAHRCSPFLESISKHIKVEGETVLNQLGTPFDALLLALDRILHSSRY